MSRVVIPTILLVEGQAVKRGSESNQNGSELKYIWPSGQWLDNGYMDVCLSLRDCVALDVTIKRTVRGGLESDETLPQFPTATCPVRPGHPSKHLVPLAGLSLPSQKRRKGLKDRCPCLRCLAWSRG